MKNIVKKIIAAGASVVLSAFALLVPAVASATFIVPQGGTGLQTITAHYILVGNGASSVGTIPTGTSGYVLTSNGASTDPTFQAPAAASSFSTSSADYFLTQRSTSNLPEGSNLYFTTARVISAMAGLFESPLTFTYPLQRSGNTVSTAFGTTTANTYSQAQTFTSGIVNNATSTGSKGFNISGGCFAINGVCISGSGGSGTPGGSDTQVQYNSSGAFAGNSALTFNSTAGRLTATYASTTGVSSSYASSTSAFFGSLTVGNLSGFLKASAGAISTASVSLTADVAGTLAVGNGGTGLSSAADGSLLFGSGGTSLTALASSTGSFLSNDYTTGRPSWKATSTLGIALTDTRGTLAIANGGTNATSQTSNGVNYFDSGKITSGAGLTFTGTNLGIGTTTPGSLLSINGVANFTTGTSTLYGTGGINLASGCFAINGVCVAGSGSGTVTSVGVSSSNSTLTIGSSPVTNSGTITADLNLANANIWTGRQNFSNASSSQLSVTGKAYFGGTATSTVDSTGAFNIVSNGLTVGTTQLVVSGGFVGIGTSTPYKQLSVNGDGVIGTLNATSSITVGSTTSLFAAGSDINNSNAFAIAYCSGSCTGTTPLSTNQFFTLTTAGRLGIGTTTPGSLLSLNGIANFTTATSTLYGTGGINLGSGCFAINGVCVGGSGGSGTVNSGTIGQLPYYAAAGTTLTATSSLFLSTAGYLGIGGTSPASSLNIFASSSNTTYGNQEVGYRMDNTSSTTNNWVSPWIVDSADGTAVASVDVQTTMHTGPARNANITLSERISGTYTRVMDIVGGNLGIGTTTPNWKLQVAGTRPSIALSDTSAGLNLKHWLISPMGGNLYFGTSTDAYGTSTPAALSFANGGLAAFGYTAHGGTKNNADGATITLDWSAGNTQEVLIAATGRTLAFSNVSIGTTMTLFVCQDGTGSRTITSYPSGIRWAGGSSPTLTTTANKCDALTFKTSTSTASIYAAANLNF